MSQRAFHFSDMTNQGNGECECANDPGPQGDRASGGSWVFRWRESSVVGVLLRSPESIKQSLVTIFDCSLSKIINRYNKQKN